jgi:hypothetical protein
MLRFTLGCFPAFAIHHEVIRVADELVPSAFQLLIQLVKDDVGQQRRRWSTLGSSQVAQGSYPGVHTCLSVRECQVYGYAL